MKLDYVPAPVVSGYRTAPITDGFNWPEIVTQLAATRGRFEQPLYLVVFRSVRKPEADGAWITLLDRAAHEEAKQSEALLHYFAGELDDNRRAMSWCLWTDMNAARAALSGPAHREAVREARSLYDNFGIELYNVHVSGAGNITFEPVARHR